MTSISPPSDLEVAKLANRTILVTGGASGIGQALVRLAHGAGANVVIIDYNKADGQKLVADLKERAHFVPADISNWTSIITAFETAYKTCGSIDVVYANAGVHTFETLLEHQLDEAGRLMAPNLKSIEINLHGTIFTAKAALYFFGMQNDGKNRQLVITGSAASLIDTPPLHLYCAAKAGVLGLMRSLRTALTKQNVSVNLIAPWMTVTPMLPDFIRDLWGDLPANTAIGVARALLVPAVRPDLNGRTLWVAGNQIIDVEEGLHSSQDVWLGGKQLSKDVDEGQKRMGIPILF